MCSKRIGKLATFIAAATMGSLVTTGATFAEQADKIGLHCFATAYVYNAAAAKRYVTSCSIYFTRNDITASRRAEANATRARAYTFQSRYAEAAADHAAAARLLANLDPRRAAIQSHFRDQALTKVSRKD